MQGLIGKKLGMTQVYDEKGHRVAVTVLEVGPCVVVDDAGRHEFPGIAVTRPQLGDVHVVTIRPGPVVKSRVAELVPLDDR